MNQDRPILEPDVYPEGWDEDRLVRLILSVAYKPKRTDLSPEERLIAQLGYVLRKNKDAFISMTGVAERRKQEIERLTGQPMKPLGENKCDF